MPASKKDIKQRLLSAIEKAEHRFTTAKLNLKEKLNLMEPISIMPYYGFGSKHYIFLKGRLMEEEKITGQQKDSSIAKHLKETYKRYESDEIPEVELEAGFADQTIKVKTDAEGYFEVEFRSEEGFDFARHGQKVDLNFLEPKNPDDQTKAEAKFFVPGKDPEFGVISDIDDTVMVSKATHFWEKLKLHLLQDATDRSPFPGIAAFLSSLQKGSDGKGHNPLFFVSASEWNLYDLLVNFMEFHDIPKGPLLLQDKGTGLDQGKFETKKEDYKIRKIIHILDSYPESKFICIGDSGQHDPETYLQLVKDYPGRILGIYIRDVTPDRRDREVKQIKEQVNAMGTEMVLVEETFSAARHALRMGWINKNQLDKIRKDCEKDSQGEK
jgi:phosphatidate phosphatase APP1